MTALVTIHLLWPYGVTGDLTYLGVTVPASVIAIRGASRRPPGERLMWLVMAFGLTLSAMADVVFYFVSWRRGAQPTVSVADPLWLSGVFMLGCGLVLVERRARAGALDVDGLIDTAAVGVVALLFAWQVSLEATLHDSSMSLVDRTVVGVYPILDALLLALAVRLALSHQARNDAGTLFGIGIAIWLAADIGFMINPGGSLTRWFDGGWMLGVALMASSIWRSPRAGEESALEDGERRVGSGRAALSVGLLATPILIDAVGFNEGRDVNPIALVTATVVLAGLVFLRSSRLLRAKEEARARMDSSERFYRALAGHVSDAVLVLDADGYIIATAPTRGPLQSIGIDALQSHARLQELFTSDRDTVSVLLERTLRIPGELTQAELRLDNAGSDTVWLEARAVNLLADPDVGGILVDLQDITSRKRAEADLQHQAFHDALTGLANRVLLHDRVDYAIARSSRGATVPAVIYLDLDGFKTVNDSLGHEAGDSLLRTVAGRLAQIVRAGDTVARLGGDEFAILVEERADITADVADLAQRVLGAFAEPITVDSRQVVMSASVGVALDDSDSTASTLLRNADVAMYQAKAGGKAQWVLFDRTMRTAAVERFQLESDLNNALRLGQLRVVYQPVVALETEKTIGFEALARWDHPELGPVPPDKFIPIAEECGLIVEIGRFVLDTACVACKKWQQEVPGAANITIAVNVSGRQLASSQFLDDVARALADSRLSPTALVLEITESVLVKDPTTVAVQLGKIRDLGVRIAIDDFGTGYSSLSYLRQFPIDILKIDRSFVNTIGDGRKIPALVRSLLDLGHALDLDLVAEGIEKVRQHELLRDAHCELGQGFLFARPMEQSEAELLLRLDAPDSLPSRRPTSQGVALGVQVASCGT